MSSRSSELLALLVLVCTLSACEREARNFEDPRASSNTARLATLFGFEVGGSNQAVTGQEYEQNAFDIAQGQRLYHWFNCAGCHAQGGGAMGPALMDDQWIYGYEPQNIRDSIVHGRPNGMPAFGARIPDRETWQVVAYVRSMAGFVPRATSPSRRDNMHVKPSEQTPPRDPPRNSSEPPSAQR